MYVTVNEIKKMILNGGGITYKGVYIPKPQRHGTMTQCATYAQMTAERIFREYREVFNS